MSNCFASVCGGIGNQLFQIAAGFSYAKKHNKKLFIDIRNWNASQGANPLTYKDNIFKNFNYNFFSVENATDFSESEFNYKEIPFYESNVVLHGYFQSLKYFENDKDEFIDKLNIPNVNTSFLRSPNVAFHIRRGDYLRFKDIHYVCDTKYFENQFKEFKGCQINVFTDSPNHVLKEFENQDFNLIQTSSELQDFVLMSKHDNIVGSNSSFSWWASLLGVKGEKIFPDKWFLSGVKHEDIYRPDMKIIKT